MLVTCGSFKCLVIGTPASLKSAPHEAVVVPIPMFPVHPKVPSTVNVEAISEVPIATPENNP